MNDLVFQRFEGIVGLKIDRPIAFEEVLTLSSYMCKASQVCAIYLKHTFMPFRILLFVLVVLIMYIVIMVFIFMGQRYYGFISFAENCCFQW